MTKTNGKIAVYGATGYTGRLIAAELARAGAEFVLAGRSAEKLKAVAAETGGDPEVSAVALDDAAGLRSLLADCAAVIAAAGPFALHGDPVVSAAADTGTHYLDTTGEQPFMLRVFEEFGPRAEAGGAALVTGMGFDYVPGDMIGALTAEGMGALDEITFDYAVSGFGASRGTAHSAVGQISGGDVEWRDGAYIPADQTIPRGRFDFPAPIGTQRMVRYPAGEHITVPRHVDTKRVRTALTASTVMPPGLGAAATVGMPLMRTLLRNNHARALTDAAIRRLPDGPKVENRRAARFEIVCEARRGHTVRRGVVRGEDVYGMTARSLVNGALRCAAPGFEGKGALAPSQAFDPAKFLADLSDFNVAYEVDPLPA